MTIKTTPRTTADRPGQSGRALARARRGRGVAAGNRQLKRQIQAERYAEAKAQGQGDQWLKDHPKAVQNMGFGKKTPVKPAAEKMDKAADNLDAGQMAKSEIPFSRKQAQVATEQINPSVFQGPTGGQSVELINGRPVVTQYESDAQRKIRETGEGLTQAGQAKAGDLMSGYKQFDAGPDAGKFQSDAGAIGRLNAADKNATAQFGASGAAKQIDPRTFQAGAGAGAQGNKLISGYQKFNMTGGEEERARIEDAVFNKITRNVERDRKQEFDDMEQRMYNRGIPLDPTNPAYKKEMDALNEKYNTIKENAMQTATEMGGAELARTFGMGLQSHQQGVSDTKDLTGLATEAYKTKVGAQDTAFQQQLGAHGENLATKGQNFDQSQRQFSTNLAAQGQDFQQDVAAYGANLQGDAQNYAQNLGEHQQGMSDMSGLQNQGFGYQKPDLPGFTAPQMQQTPAGQIGTDISAQKTSTRNQQIAADAQIQAAKIAAAAGEKEESW